MGESEVAPRSRGTVGVVHALPGKVLGRGEEKVVESLKAARVVSLRGTTARVYMAAGDESRLQVERSPMDFARRKEEHASPHQNN